MIDDWSIDDDDRTYVIDDGLWCWVIDDRWSMVVDGRLSMIDRPILRSHAEYWRYNCDSDDDDDGDAPISTIDGFFGR